MKLSEKDAKDMSKTGDQLSVCSARSLLPNANVRLVRSVTDVG